MSIVRKVNVGKSTLFNLITGQKNKSIVDNKAGTTADSVKSLMEIHGFGAVKIIDTAGIDESGELGEKKRQKTLNVIDNSDLIILVVKNGVKKLSKEENDTLIYIKKQNKQHLVIYNDFSGDKNYDVINDCKCSVVNCNDFSKQLVVTDFIIKNYKKQNVYAVDFLPNVNLCNRFVLLVIPMDEESPELRLLRPQSITIERLLKAGAIPVLYKPSLKDFNAQEFKSLIDSLKDLFFVITDSQALGTIYSYIPNNVYLTTFSMLMTNFMSGGNILRFFDGVKKLCDLQNNGNVLIVEACKHDRKCNDIATVQIPNIIKKITNYKNINIDFNFGDTFMEEEKLKKYDLAIICGGCMIDKQEYNSRLRLLDKLNIKYINYGMVFACANGLELLHRCFKVFRLK